MGLKTYFEKNAREFRNDIPVLEIPIENVSFHKVNITDKFILNDITYEVLDAYYINEYHTEMWIEIQNKETGKSEFHQVFNV